ncbi:Mitochondrion protein [Lasiodiplodia theobromae]|uniref:Mitochondrion protein n=1 Tax=Lasiodiplodia theobromae TaxID=45133 RepID=UPI0015C37744|nr:Mitochondrion protein [Lasiodiplodia theobromae]KAF4538972.1 Mitochondrion protein [Lasiodiplodia theobromae]
MVTKTAPVDGTATSIFTIFPTGTSPPTVVIGTPSLNQLGQLSPPLNSNTPTGTPVILGGASSSSEIDPLVTSSPEGDISAFTVCANTISSFPIHPNASSPHLNCVFTYTSDYFSFVCTKPIYPHHFSTKFVSTNSITTNSITTNALSTKSLSTRSVSTKSLSAEPVSAESLSADTLTINTFSTNIVSS